MVKLEPRELSANEASVIAAALKRAPTGKPCSASEVEVSRLRVVGRCECGCDSLFFSGIAEAMEQFRVADGLGYTEDGEEIGVILWARGDSLVHLELYNYGEQPARLPIAATVCPFEESRRVRQ